MTDALRIGSLFSGIAGLELGVIAALDDLDIHCKVVWQAEKEPYARAVLSKHWPQVHRFEDVHDVDADAPPADIICGGFPCQDLSIAGARAGIDGERSGLWREFARIIRDLRPRYVFVENVPELLAYLGRVLGPLAALGYDAEWGVFSAAEVGAPHLRERLFVLAHAVGVGREGGKRGRARAQYTAAPRPRSARALADADGRGQLQPPIARQPAGVVGARDGGAFPDASGDHVHAQQITLTGCTGAADSRGDGEDRSVAHADGRGFPRRQQSERREDAGRRRRPQARTEPPGPAAWPPEPDVGRVVDGVRTRLDGSRRRARLRCLGNGVVAAQARLAFLTLARRAGLFGLQEAHG